MCSCHAVFDYEGSSSAQYRVRFLDDVNLKFADAFDSEVQTLALCVFDDNGFLVDTYTADADSLSQATTDHSIDISNLAPGAYHLVAWGGVSNESSFKLPELSRDASHLSDLTCRLDRLSRADEVYDLVDSDINDLFHGATDIVIPTRENATDGIHSFDIHLTKNTNKVSIVLQQLNGEKMNADDFDFTIVADNGHINYDNSVIHDEKNFIYRAYSKAEARAGIDSDGRSTTGVNAVVARHTVNRLEATRDDDNASLQLEITRTDTGEKIVSIPLVDYVLMVRNNYPQIATDQDYLDRQDEYNLVFFINDGKWLDSVIYINSWRIIINNNDIQ